MKFGKEFKSQMIPEWHEAYMNYDYLKSLLKDIHNFKLKTKPKVSVKGTPKRTMTMYRAFSGLTRRYSNLTSPSTDHLGHHHHHHDIEDQVILVNAVDHNHVDDGLTDFHHQYEYETKFLRSTEDGGEYELVFFRRLDDEFNKVNKFYKDQVDEVLKEADLLNKQMDALIAFRIKVDNPDEIMMMNNSPQHFSVELTRLASDIAASAAAVSLSPPTGARTNTVPSPVGVHVEVVHMDAIEEIEQGKNEGLSDESGDDTIVNVTDGVSHNSTIAETKPKSTMKASRPASLHVLNRVTLNNTLETPRSTIKGLLNVNKDKELTFGREDLRKVEEQLQRAFVEFYQKLRLLKSYSFMNLLAFSKIMKKYDKIASRNAKKSYFHMVDNSYLGSSDEVARLMERVEVTFIKHFTNANRGKGIRILRPQAKRERHRVTFALGLFSGCTLALLLALILNIVIKKITHKQGSTQYMENLFPLYSLFGFVVLHMLMYAINVYAWRRYRVNYSFIFGFKQGTELGYREVFLLSSALATLALASVLANLDMEMDKETMDYKKITELIPLLLLILVTVVTFCPFNIIYRSSRFFLIRCAFHCLCAPLYKVLLPDFFLADQLTSQVQAIRSLEFYICYYGWGDYTHRKHRCKFNDTYNVFYFIIATIPYWFRLLQCLRRAFEEKDRMQGYNALKYFSTIVAVLTRTAYSRQDTTTWLVMAWISSAIAALVSTYWDIVIDWGLLQKNSKNRWLRDKLLVSQKSVYFGAIVLNILLRFAWLQTVLNLQVSFLHKEALIAIVASLEIIRRGMWNFFRLENEHLNNVGKYRAFKSVPLPFNYDEDDDKDE